jgi:hypothetical protein
MASVALNLDQPKEALVRTGHIAFASHSYPPGHQMALPPGVFRNSPAMIIACGVGDVQENDFKG